MRRNSLSAYLLYLAVLALPLSYGTKDWFSLDVRWIPPSLLLALLSALLQPKLGKTDFGTSVLATLVCWALATSLSGALRWWPEVGDLAALYRVIRYPALLALSVALFLRTRAFLLSSPLGSQVLLSCLSLAVTLELILAIYLAFAASRWDSLPFAELGRLRCEAQTLKLLEKLPLCRLTGTFGEGPQFGLFMLVSMVLFSTALITLPRRRPLTLRSLYVGLLLSAVGSFMSLSDQIFIAAAVFLLALVALAFKKRRLMLCIAALAASGVVVVVSWANLSWKLNQADLATHAPSPLGTSIGERLFHAKFVLTELITTPYTFVFGVGQGRYGDYVSSIEVVFPDTTSPQWVLIAWLAEYGVIGAFGWLVFLGWVLFRAWKSYGILGLGATLSLVAGNMFQAQWVSEAWFFGLAFLTAPSPTPARRSGSPLAGQQGIRLSAA